ncbi:MAG: septal ring lytic transglycosylase RlpA family protein [Gammaproteobacteria bacterium]
MPAQKDGPPPHSIDVSQIPPVIPKPEPRSRSGNPAFYDQFGKRYHVLSTGHGYHERGIASWYGTKFHNRATSSGEPYDLFKITAAHKTLPIPSYVKVTNLENGKQLIVRVNDRGPFVANRIIDLSYAAAKKLGYVQKGTALVDVTIIDPHQPSIALTPATQKVKYGKPLIFVQVGAFNNAANAQQLRQRIQHVLQQKSAIQFNHTLPDSLYKVRIGPLANVAKADQIIQQLQNAGLHNSITVVE